MQSHGEDLRQISGDAKLARAVMEDYRKADLGPRDRAIADFAIQVAIDAHGVDSAAIDRFRDAGLSDEDVLNVVQITGYFCYYNRMVDALGVRPEDFMEPENPDSEA